MATERRRRRVRGSRIAPSKRKSDVYFQPNNQFRDKLSVLKQANEWHAGNNLDDIRRLAAELNVNSAGERTGDLSPVRGRDLEERSGSISPASSPSPSPEKIGQQISKKRTAAAWPADDGGGVASTEPSMRSRKGMLYDKAQRMARWLSGK